MQRIVFGLAVQASESIGSLSFGKSGDDEGALHLWLVNGCETFDRK